MRDIVIPTGAVDAFLGSEPVLDVERTMNGLRAAAPAILEANRLQLDAAATRRGAVKALRDFGRDCRGMAERYPEMVLVWNNYAEAIEAEATRIESGEVTL